FHHRLALRSIDSFLAQTYSRKHLLIVNDGEQSFDFLNSSLATELKLDRKYTLGELRNIALDWLPENALWIQWDDDDWRHPNLIEEQTHYLLSQKADLCCLTSQIQYAFSIDAAWEVRRPLEGTILCRKKENMAYPPIPKGEDTIFFCLYEKNY